MHLLGQINKWIPKDSEVLLIADQAIYFINEIHPPQIDKYGYVFLKHSNEPDTIEELAQFAQYTITNESFLERLQQKGISVVSILKENHFIFEANVGDQLKIWRKEIL